MAGVNFGIHGILTLSLKQINPLGPDSWVISTCNMINEWQLSFPALAILYSGTSTIYTLNSAFETPVEKDGSQNTTHIFFKQLAN